MDSSLFRVEDKKPAISISNITNRFGDLVVHDNISFDIAAKEIMALVGGSGSGKSVMLKTITGLHSPESGHIEMNYGNNFGMLFQNGALFSNLTVLENIMLPIREHTKLDKDDIHNIARLKLTLSGLPEHSADKYPSELSGGMKKRASLARALALDPKILFLDEPTAGLDPIAAAAFDDLILNLKDNLGLTVVIITHDLDTIFTICDKIAVLVDKKIIVDTLDGLLQNPHPWIKEYFHGPRSRAALITNGKYGNES